MFSPPAVAVCGWTLLSSCGAGVLIREGVRAATPRCARCGRRTWWGEQYLSVLPPRPGRYRLYGYPWTTRDAAGRKAWASHPRAPSEHGRRACLAVRTLHSTRCRPSNQQAVQQSKRTKDCASKELPVSLRGPRLIHTVCKPRHTGMRAGPQLGPQERAAQKMRGGRKSKEKCKRKRETHPYLYLYVLRLCQWQLHRNFLMLVDLENMLLCSISARPTWTMSELPTYRAYLAAQMSQTLT